MENQFNLPILFFYQMDATEISIREPFNVAFSNAALHWVKDHKTVLVCLKNLHRNAKILLQMGGYGNARDVLAAVDQVTTSENRQKYFDNFVFPYRFCNISDYEKWLPETGFQAQRIELIEK